ncbi:MAG: hypothetical protein OHK0041_12620 [Anaerolineales bacterium]
MISKRKIYLALIVIFGLYAIVRLMWNYSVIYNPGTIEDTTAYLRISRKSILSREFWADARPFVFPLLLKLTGQNLPLTSFVQIVFSIFSWGWLGFVFTSFLRNDMLKIVAFSIFLALSLVRNFANWDYMILTESLSLSLFVLFLACGLWLLKGWSRTRAAAFVMVGMLFAFVRDTNAYVILFLSGLLLIAVLLRWIPLRNLVLVISFAVFFVLSNWMSDSGWRWVFPLNNNIGKRILPSEQAVRFLENCGMPVTPQLMALSGEFAGGRDRAFYNDPALEGYRTWLYQKGKSCYMKYLLNGLPGHIMAVVGEFDFLMKYKKIQSALVPGYDPIIPFFMEGFVYPVNSALWLWILMTLVALFLLWRRQWRDDPIGGVFIILCLLIFPHLFVTWFGDAMAPERHSLSVGLQFAISAWMMILLSIDRWFCRMTRMNSVPLFAGGAGTDHQKGTS